MTAGLDEQSASPSVYQHSDRRQKYANELVVQPVQEAGTPISQQYYEDETEQMKSQLGKQIDKKALYVYNQSN